MLQLIIFGVQEAIKAEPALVAGFQDIFSKGTLPTDADFDTLRATVASESYLKFVPNSAIKP